VPALYFLPSELEYPSTQQHTVSTFDNGLTLLAPTLIHRLPHRPSACCFSSPPIRQITQPRLETTVGTHESLNMMSSSVQELAAAVDDEDVWVSSPLDATDPLNNSLKEFEQEMRCPICCEFLYAPVSVIPCSHTFCSECIRTNFKKVSECCAFIFRLVAACADC
jgi:hypothetical protein